MPLNSLQSLYVDQLKDVYNAEKQIVRALPKMIKAASSPDLQSAFQQHLELTQQQVTRLEKIFKNMGKNPASKKCKGMEGLLEEGKELFEMDIEDDVRDAGLIGAAQKVEHYEIAAYGTLRTFAEMIGDDRAVELLQQTLDEEHEADRMLTQIAMSGVNQHAAGESYDT